MSNGTHWTERSIDDFVHRISSDFVVQLEKKIDDDEVKQRQLAERLGISGPAVSQTLNNPGNFELKTMVQYARALGMKVAVVVYDDNDPENKKGPIVSEMFSKSWEKIGKPEDFSDLESAVTKGSVPWVVYEGPTRHAQTGRMRQSTQIIFTRFAANEGRRRA